MHAMVDKDTDGKWKWTIYEGMSRTSTGNEVAVSTKRFIDKNTCYRELSEATNRLMLTYDIDGNILVM